MLVPRDEICYASRQVMICPGFSLRPGSKLRELPAAARRGRFAPRLKKVVRPSEQVGIWAFGANRKIDSLENILPPGPEGALDARFSKAVAPGIRRGGVLRGPGPKSSPCCKSLLAEHKIVAGA